MKNQFILKYQGKDLKMPYWGYFEEYVELKVIPQYNACLFINTSHPLNTKFNGLFKDCIYGNYNDIAVKVRQFDNLKIGDVFEYYGSNIIIISYDILKGFVNHKNESTINVNFINANDMYSKYYKGNLLDEYLSGKNELVKLCRFND